jgi:hypothetical protein
LNDLRQRTPSSYLVTCVGHSASLDHVSLETKSISDRN